MVETWEKEEEGGEKKQNWIYFLKQGQNVIVELGHGADIKQFPGVPWKSLHRSFDGQGGVQEVGLGFPKREMGEQTRKSPQSQNSLGVPEAKKWGNN